ncbi:molecular chaperone [Escherichia coli]|nr:molecular chaperone [Escherichia coli]
MRVIIIRFIAVWLLVLSVSATCFSRTLEESERNGISFYVLRIIYNDGDKNGAALTIENKSSEPYLLQSLVRPVDLNTGDVDLNVSHSAVMPFIVTPPLTRLEAGQNLQLRIRRNGQPLPLDRESVFFISMKSLPAQSQNSDSGQMVMTVISNIKLFYRPQGLAKQVVADVTKTLKFSKQGNKLIATNPSPYWCTFAKLKIGTIALDKAALRLMVPPFGQQSYTVPQEASGEISWQLIDEDGWNTEEARQILPSS